MSTLSPIGSRFRALAFAASFFTFALVIIGGIVRLTDSGMGCPDWPLCYGQLIPPSEFHTNVEFTHRLVAVAVGLIGATLLLTALIKYRRESRLVNLLWIGALFYAVQAALGGVTVLAQNAPWTVSLHLINSMFLFAAMLIITLYVFARRSDARRADAIARGGFSRLVLINAAGVLVLIVSGSIVFSSGASGACISWPLCDSNLIPANSSQWIHMAHRLIAGLIGIYLIVTCVRAQRMGGATERAGTWLLWIFIAQILVGGANVLLGFPLALNALHLALATAVWGLAVILVAVAQIETGTGWLGADTL